MKEQLIEMGFSVWGSSEWLYFFLDDGTLWVRVDGLVDFEEYRSGTTTLATNATIEQISNILKSIQI